MNTLDCKIFFLQAWPLVLDLLSHVIFLSIWIIWRYLSRTKENPPPIPLPTPASSWFWSTPSNQEPLYQEIKGKETNYESPFGALLVVLMWAIAKTIVASIDELLVKFCTDVRTGIVEYGSSLKESLKWLSGHITMNIPVVSVLSQDMECFIPYNRLQANLNDTNQHPDGDRTEANPAKRLDGGSIEETGKILAERSRDFLASTTDETRSKVPRDDINVAHTTEMVCQISDSLHMMLICMKQIQHHPEMQNPW